MTESTDQPNITDESNQDLLQDGDNDHENNNSNTNALSPIPFQALSKHYPKLNAFSSFIGWAIILIIMLVVDLLVDKINLHFLVLPGLLIFSLLSGVVGYFSAKACGYYQDEFDSFRNFVSSLVLSSVNKSLKAFIVFGSGGPDMAGAFAVVFKLIKVKRRSSGK